jgi:hypothetical protein
MKNAIFFLCIFSFFLITNKTFSQGEAAVPFLTFPISPSQNAMGYTGTSLPIDDPYGFLLNPAQLGHKSQHTNFSLMLYPSKVKLWGFDNFQINGTAFNVGYNFKEVIGIPLSLGFGYANNEFTLDYYLPQYTDNAGDKDKYTSYSFGVGIDYFVQFNAGITYKSISSKISSPAESASDFEANAKTIDFGFLLNVPALKLIDDKITFSILNNKPMKPFFDFSFGYSQSNIGDEIYYVDPAQSDPLPRTARLGYGISTGVDMQIDRSPLKVFGVDFTVDVEDLLLQYKTDGNTLFPLNSFDGYQSFIGDINIGRNIIQIKGDDNVIAHAGVQLNFLESFLLKYGHMTGKSLNNRSTNGFEIRTAGALKFLSSFTNNSFVKFLANHFDLRYYNSNYSVAEGLETNIKGISIYIQNLNSLF